MQPDGRPAVATTTATITDIATSTKQTTNSPTTLEVANQENDLRVVRSHGGLQRNKAMLLFLVFIAGAACVIPSVVKICSKPPDKNLAGMHVSETGDAEPTLPLPQGQPATRPPSPPYQPLPVQPRHGMCAAPMPSQLRWGSDVQVADYICCNNHFGAENFGYWRGTSFLAEEAPLG